MPPDGEKNSVVDPLSIKKIVLLNKRLLNSDLGRLEKCLELETQELAKNLKHTDGWKQSLECE